MGVIGVSTEGSAGMCAPAMNSNNEPYYCYGLHHHVFALLNMSLIISYKSTKTSINFPPQTQMLYNIPFDNMRRNHEALPLCVIIISGKSTIYFSHSLKTSFLLIKLVL